MSGVGIQQVNARAGPILNERACTLRLVEGDTAQVLMVTFWESEDFLQELEPCSTRYEM
jgi:hypothetical protein